MEQSTKLLGGRTIKRVFIKEIENGSRPYYRITFDLTGHKEFEQTLRKCHKHINYLMKMVFYNLRYKVYKNLDRVYRLTRTGNGWCNLPLYKRLSADMDSGNAWRTDKSKDKKYYRQAILKNLYRDSIYNLANQLTDICYREDSFKKCIKKKSLAKSMKAPSNLISALNRKSKEFKDEKRMIVRFYRLGDMVDLFKAFKAIIRNAEVNHNAPVKDLTNFSKVYIQMVDEFLENLNTGINIPLPKEVVGDIKKFNRIIGVIRRRVKSIGRAADNDINIALERVRDKSCIEVKDDKFVSIKLTFNLKVLINDLNSSCTIKGEDIFKPFPDDLNDYLVIWESAYKSRRLLRY